MDDRHLSLYLPMVKAIMAHWWADVGLGPGAILLFVNDRTYRYGKAVERIPERHFLHGIDAAQTGEVVHGGLPMGKTTLWKSIDLLTERELLGVERVRHQWRGSFYSLNAEKILEPVAMSKLKESRQSRIRPGVRRRRSQKLATGRTRTRGGSDSDGDEARKKKTRLEDAHATARLASAYGASQKTIEALLGGDVEGDSAPNVVRETAVSRSRDEQHVVRETNNRSTDINTDREQRISSDAFGGRVSLEDIHSNAERVRQEVLQKRAAARERKAVRRKRRNAGHGYSARALRDEWIHQYAKLMDEEYAWSITDKEAGMMRRNIKGVRLPDDGVPGLFAAAIVHWKLIRTEKLKWSKDVPRGPDFAFCAKFIRYVARAVQEIEADTEATAQERKGQSSFKRSGDMRQWPPVGVDPGNPVGDRLMDRAYSRSFADEMARDIDRGIADQIATFGGNGEPLPESPNNGAMAYLEGYGSPRLLRFDGGEWLEVEEPPEEQTPDQPSLVHADFGSPDSDVYVTMGYGLDTYLHRTNRSVFNPLSGETQTYYTYLIQVPYHSSDDETIEYSEFEDFGLRADQENGTLQIYFRFQGEQQWREMTTVSVAGVDRGVTPAVLGEVWEWARAVARLVEEPPRPWPPLSSLALRAMALAFEGAPTDTIRGASREIPAVTVTRRPRRLSTSPAGSFIHLSSAPHQRQRWAEIMAEMVR